MEGDLRGLIAGFVSVLACFLTVQARAEIVHPPLEAYGELPGISGLEISPDSKHLAFFARMDGDTYVFVRNIETGESRPIVAIDKISARYMVFADNDHLLVKVSDATRMAGFRGEIEFSTLVSINIHNPKKRKYIHNDIKNLYPAQSGLGKIVGHLEGTNKVLIPAYVGPRGADPSYALLSVNVATGYARTIHGGRQHTIDWFVDHDGSLLAREDLNNDKNIYSIWTAVGGKKRKIYETDSARTPFSLVGVKSDKSSLILVDSGDGEEGFDAVYEMDFDGNITETDYGRDDADIDRVITDAQRFAIGIKYSGIMPSYHFFDPDIDAAVQSVVGQLTHSSVQLVTWTEDWSKIIYLLEDGSTSGSYLLHDVASGQLTILAHQRDNIPQEALGLVYAIEYPARDGLTIPAILTLPAGVEIEDARNLPLILMPHGGPESYDSIGFHYRAQYFANRGYLVLQPNFRGSSGHGAAFTVAGYGEWGRKMQDDLTDGVNVMIRDKFADPERVCIVGASYGGYAALAGGAFTPDLYKCVVAIAPVADLPKMLADERRDMGRNHWVLDYWSENIGDPKTNKDLLKEVSPANHAEAFQAPVLLIHGDDDTVVPISQSRVMERALKKANKPVSFVRLKGEDHWMSQAETRTDALRATAAFVDQHIGPGSAATEGGAP